MSVNVLLNHDDPWFAFEHFNAHRTYLGAMAPLTRFSTIPYLIDPELNTGEPASGWHLNHQAAHNDANSALPTFYDQSFHGVEDPLHGLFMGPSVVDTNLADEYQKQWYTFVNHTEHLMADNALLPVTDMTRYQYPFS